MHDIFLIIHFIGLAMGVGTSIGFMFLGIASSKLEKADAKKFAIHSFSLSRMGHIGITLLIISGIFLLGPYWETLFENPLLIIKLVLVLVLSAMIGIQSSFVRKAKTGDFKSNIKKIAMLGRISLLTGLAIVVLAVFVFH